MKKLLCSIFTAALLWAAGTSALASEPGDIIGDVYPTDIRTYFFNEPINAYNIGGKTAVICEDLNWFYGFDVEWDGDARTLRVTDKHNGAYYDPESAKYQRDIAQNIKNLPTDYFSRPLPEHILFTDIKTYLNGQEIQAYNLNGQTAILCEDMRDFGYRVLWDDQERTLRVEEIREVKTAQADLGTVVLTAKLGNTADTIPAAQQFRFDGTAERLNVLSEYNGQYVPLLKMLDLLKVSYSWDGETLALTSDTPLPAFEAEDLERSSEAPAEKDIWEFYMKVIFNGEPREIVTRAGGTLLTNGQVYDKPVSPYFYEGQVYVPVRFIETLINPA